MTEWNALSEPLQLHLATAALHQASQTLATQAEMLAGEMETGSLRDQGGPDALRLLAAIFRATSLSSQPAIGNA